MVSEQQIQQHIREYAAGLNARLFRNNVGVLTDARGQHVTYGLCVGSSDLIGDYPLDGVAVFMAVEVKRPGQRMTPAQTLFIRSVNDRAGRMFGWARVVLFNFYGWRKFYPAAVCPGSQTCL